MLVEEAYVDIAAFGRRRGEARLEEGAFAGIEHRLLQHRVPGIDLGTLRVADREAQPRAIALADYRAPDYTITDTELTFEIADGETEVTSRLSVVRGSDSSSTVLTLDGQDLTLVSVSLDDRELTHNEYAVDDRSLTLFDVPERATVEVVTRIRRSNLARASRVAGCRRLLACQGVLPSRQP